AGTSKSNSQHQSDPMSSCVIGCGGNGQAQLNWQQAETLQLAESRAAANQNAVNANVPVNIAGGDVYGGTNSANQNASNGAESSSGNNSETSQSNSQTQEDPSSSCLIGCGGNGQAQLSWQKSTTVQEAQSQAEANQNAVNANVPV